MNWLDTLQDKYLTADKGFMGHVVHNDDGSRHMNGGGVYPCDVLERCPSILGATDLAWDGLMRNEMMHDCLEVNELIQQVGFVKDGKPHRTDGEPPTFRTIEDVKNLVSPSAVIFHRCKDGSLISRLQEMKS